MKVKLIKSAYSTHNICEKVGSVVDKPKAVAEELIEMKLAVKATAADLPKKESAAAKKTRLEAEKEAAEAKEAAENAAKDDQGSDGDSDDESGDTSDESGDSNDGDSDSAES